MTIVLLIVLIAWPLLEIAVLIKVGEIIGFWPIFGIVIATFIIGASVLARSGLSAAFRVQEAIIKGEAPMAAMLEGALLATAGVLLVTPGLIADILGGLLLVPPLRMLCANWFLKSAFKHFEVHTASTTFEERDTFSETRDHHRPPRGGDQPAGSGPVIDGEFERLDERPMDSENDRRRGGTRGR
ncbi:MAG: FxsA family protein [Hyphomicrobiaceae bacterium]